MRKFIHLRTPRYLPPRITGMPLFPEAGMHWMSTATPLAAHANPGFEVTHVLSGRVAWKVLGGPVLRLKGGEIAITQPEVLHRGELNVIEPCKLFWFVVNPDAPRGTTLTPFTRPDLDAFGVTLRSAGNCVVKACAGMRHAHMEMASLLSRSPPDEAFSPEDIPCIRLHLLGGLIAVRESLHPKSEEARREPLVDRAVGFMTRNLEGGISMTAIAEEVGVSVRTLHSLFRKSLGQTPADYYGRLRLAKARELLAERRLSISVVAVSLKKKSSQYFANCFKRYTGLTPRQYRRKGEGRGQL